MKLLNIDKPKDLYVHTHTHVNYTHFLTVVSETQEAFLRH